MSKKLQSIKKKILSSPAGVWTVEDLMKQTGLARQTIYNKVSKGEFPHRKRWGALYFYIEEINEIICKQDEVKKPGNIT